MVVIFDLDDTLYKELSYVKSGFMEVSNYLEQTFGIPALDAYKFMLTDLEINGRGKIFDSVLSKYGQFNLTQVRKCISIYRLHKPNISLPQSSKNCITLFSDIPTYIVTDGNKIVQHLKIESLGLYSMVKKVFITHRYGLRHAKPSPYCFNLIKEKEKTTPKEIVYVADNIKKDFVGIKPLGYKTIRVKTGNYKNVRRPASYEADKKINSLDELTFDLINSILN